jgi:hypothetical protein
MTSKEFVIWMKGFMEACNDYTATPKQWDRIKEELEKVTDEQKPIGTPIGIGGFGTVNVTPGTTGILNIPNLNTSTTYVNPQSGSWHYTNS